MADQTPDPASDSLDQVIGLQMVDVNPGMAQAYLDIDDRHKQPYGIVHGGIYCAMAETVASVGGVFAIQDKTGSDDAGAVGQSNHTDFLKAQRSGRLTATATPVHVGRSVQLWNVDITNAEDELVAQSKVRLFNVGVDRMSS
jgi:uncharacterized protein (TIGR00369 family)